MWHVEAYEAKITAVRKTVVTEKIRSDKMEKQPVPTPAEIWKILKEVSLGQKENREQIKEMDRWLLASKQEADRRKQEMDRWLLESKQETDRKIQENQQRYDQMRQKSQEDLKKLIQENKLEAKKRAEENRLHLQQIDSRWGNQWGILVEALIEGSLVQVFKERGIDVTRTLPNHRGHYQKKEREFDAIAIDGKELVVVEAKSHFILEKVDYFLKTLEDFKKYCPEFSPWTVFGGIACLRKNPEVFSYAEERGLFVLRVQGKNAMMLNKPQFKPKVFA